MNELALPPNTIVVPDTIEPYLGWKAFAIQDDHIVSPQQNDSWPHKTRMEAVCKRTPQSLRWQAIKIGETLPKKPYYVAYGRPGESIIVDLIAPSGARETYYSHPMQEGYDRWVATARNRYEEHLVVADNECSCGIYAVADVYGLTSYYNDDCIIAKVALWGHTRIADKGARGQYAYPQTLYARWHQKEMVARLAELYDCNWDFMPVYDKQVMLTMMSVKR